jgi:NAD-dependent deacetylase
MARPTCDEVEAELDDPRVIIVDVRDEDREGFGHIQGSWHSPSDHFSAKLLLDDVKEFAPRARKLVFHCAQSRSRGPSCAADVRGELDRRKECGEATKEERALQVTTLCGGFDAWYELGYPRCFCDGAACSKMPELSSTEGQEPAPVPAPSANTSVSGSAAAAAISAPPHAVGAQRALPAGPPPVLLLSDTRLLWTPVSEEVWDRQTSGVRSHGRPVHHLLFKELAASARRVKPEMESRKLRAAFIGALSGDASMVQDSFSSLVQTHMEPAEGRAIRVYLTRRLSDSDRAYLLSADVIVVGGCVSSVYRELMADETDTPVGMVKGLEAMHAAGVFEAMRSARAAGAICVGVLEGAVALGDGWISDSDAKEAESASNFAETSCPRYCASLLHGAGSAGVAAAAPDAIAGVGGAVEARGGGALARPSTAEAPCGALLPGTIVGIGESKSSRWPTLCATLAAAAAPHESDGGAVTRALGLPPRSGVLCYDDGSACALGDVAVSAFMRRSHGGDGGDGGGGDGRGLVGRQQLELELANALDSLSSPSASGTVGRGKGAGTAGRTALDTPAGTKTTALLRTLLVASCAPFDQVSASAADTDSDVPTIDPLWHGPHRVAESKLKAAARALKGCRRLVAFTGAGISAESGMPTFRETVAVDEPIGADGAPLNKSAYDMLTPLWTQTDPGKAANIEVFHEDPREWWKGERAMLGAFGLAHPNAAHVALAQMQKAGILSGVVTQNIDGLHQQAGCTPESVVELHGTVHRLECAGVPKTGVGSSSEVGISDAEAFRRASRGPQDDRCGWSCDMDLRKVDDAESKGRAPSCPSCGGFLKTATVLFGEQLPTAAQQKAKRMMLECDGLLVVGTSLNVYPAASYPTIVRGGKLPSNPWEPPIAAGGRSWGSGEDRLGGGCRSRFNSAPIVEVNAMHTTSPAAPDVMITGRAGEWLPRLAALLLGRDELAPSRWSSPPKSRHEPSSTPANRTLSEACL